MNTDLTCLAMDGIRFIGLEEAIFNSCVYPCPSVVKIFIFL